MSMRPLQQVRRDGRTDRTSVRDECCILRMSDRSRFWHIDKQVKKAKYLSYHEKRSSNEQERRISFSLPPRKSRRGWWQDRDNTPVNQDPKPRLRRAVQTETVSVGKKITDCRHPHICLFVISFTLSLIHESVPHPVPLYIHNGLGC